MKKVDMHLSWNDIEEIVREELVESYAREKVSNKIDNSNDIIKPDTELLRALERVIEYYSSPDQFHEWKAQNSDS